MKKTFTVDPFHEREITRDDLFETEERMVRFFGGIVRQMPHEGRFPRWNDSVDQLMEVARWLARSRRLRNGATGRPMPMNLHRRRPHNIYAVARQSERSGRPDVVTYYTRLRVLGGVSLSAFVDVVEPLRLPRLTSYRGVFERGGRNG